MGICESTTANQVKLNPGNNSETKNNYIIAEIYIEEKDINTEKQIINSYGENLRQLENI